MCTKHTTIFDENKINTGDIIEATFEVAHVFGKTTKTVKGIVIKVEEKSIEFYYGNEYSGLISKKIKASELTTEGGDATVKVLYKSTVKVD